MKILSAESSTRQFIAPKPQKSLQQKLDSLKIKIEKEENEFAQADEMLKQPAQRKQMYLAAITAIQDLYVKESKKYSELICAARLFNHLKAKIENDDLLMELNLDDIDNSIEKARKEILARYNKRLGKNSKATAQARAIAKIALTDLQKLIK